MVSIEEMISRNDELEYALSEIRLIIDIRPTIRNRIPQIREVLDRLNVPKVARH